MEATATAQKGKNMTELHKHSHTGLDKLFRYAEVLDFGDIHIKYHRPTGLRAIVAIHNLKLGPAIGGCRLIHYHSADNAVEDALRLAYMMSYKAAISNLPHGGAKAVLMKPKVIKDRTAYFEAFGDFINELGGRYITAMDSGTTQKDMDVIATRTSFVTCTTISGTGGNPAPYTALGVRRGIEAAVKFKLGQDNLQNIHVAIQGAGQVGYYLAKELHQLGARITQCDVNQLNLDRCIEEFGVMPCSVEEIYDIKADVFAPCALGSTLNLETIKRLNTGIVVGSANNQLAHHKHGKLLEERGILYAPDFVVNSGGLIYVAAIYDHADTDQAIQQVKDIYSNLMQIFARAQQENLPTTEVAEKIALEKLGYVIK